MKAHNGWNDFCIFSKTMKHRAEDRAMWQRRQRIKRLKGRIVALGVLQIVLDVVINQAVASYFKGAA